MRVAEAAVEEKGVQESFIALFHRGCNVPCEAYFRAPQQLIHRHLSEEAVKRGLPATRRGGKPWHNRQVLSHGNSKRLDGYEERSVSCGRSQRGIANLAQNSSMFRIENVVPALLRRSLLWSFQCRRRVQPAEAVEVQGMRLFSEVEKFVCPFKHALLGGRFTGPQIRSMAGNAMHPSAIGVCLTFVLAATEAE